MNTSRRIVYVGPLDAGGTCRQRFEALASLGHQLEPIDTAPSNVREAQRGLLYRARRRLFGPTDLAGANAKLRELLKSRAADILWLDKALTVEAATLREVRTRWPACRIVGYSPDDMAARHNQSRAFLGHLPLYDVFFTTKSFGVAELRAMGCRHVICVGNAFDPATHRPMPVTDETRARLGGAVGFIGNWEPQRETAFAPLVEREIPVRVWGQRWERCRRAPCHLRLERRPVWSDDYAQAVSAFDINLGLLSKLNRDRTTTRSVEIPACGGFLLAERTAEHQELFEEDVEAVYFGSSEELADKTRFYLQHVEVRMRIARAGRERCWRGGYSCHDRLRGMLRDVEALA